MTTIVYRDGVLATDSRATVNGLIAPYKANKIIPHLKHPDYGDMTFAICGDYVEGRAALDNLLKKETYKAQDADVRYQILGVNELHQRVWVQGEEHTAGEDVSNGSFFAMGSGEQVALGALYAGACAVHAVEIAAKADPKTGGDVQYWTCPSKQKFKNSEDLSTEKENA